VARGRIQLVSTSVSSLEEEQQVSSASAVPDVAHVRAPSTMSDAAEVTMEIEQESSGLRLQEQSVKDSLDDFHEDDVDIPRIATVERDLDRIQIGRNEF
jgi:hypothetical protein